MFVLCVRAQPDIGLDMETIYVWKGSDFDSDGMISDDEFIEQVKCQYWGVQAASTEIVRINELPGNESDEFLNYFDWSVDEWI